MTPPIFSDATLDRLLAWQIAVAWAGERAIEPPRLGWWNSAFADELGGMDLFGRLAPRTGAWAALEAAVRAARAEDTARRRRLPSPDAVRTIFHLGYDLDEALANRLRDLKRGPSSPAEALPLPLDLGEVFSPLRLERALEGAGAAPEVEAMPAGRKLQGRIPTDPVLMVERLAAALLPLGPDYPCPFFYVLPK